MICSNISSDMPILAVILVSSDITSNMHILVSSDITSNMLIGTLLRVSVGRCEVYMACNVSHRQCCGTYHTGPIRRVIRSAGIMCYNHMMLVRYTT